LIEKTWDKGGGWRREDHIREKVKGTTYPSIKGMPAHRNALYDLGEGVTGGSGE